MKNYLAVWAGPYPTYFTLSGETFLDVVNNLMVAKDINHQQVLDTLDIEPPTRLSSIKEIVLADRTAECVTTVDILNAVDKKLELHCYLHQLWDWVADEDLQSLDTELRVGDNLAIDWIKRAAKTNPGRCLKLSRFNVTPDSVVKEICQLFPEIYSLNIPNAKPVKLIIREGNDTEYQFTILPTTDMISSKSLVQCSMCQIQTS